MRASQTSGLPLALLLLLPAPAVSRRQSPQTAPPAPDQSAATSITVPLPQGTRLVLKDGNFMMVREYKIQGERVRYWSLERSAWEEIPAELVDWEATHSGEKAEAARKQQIEKNLEEMAQEQRSADLNVDASIEVAPNVFLPAEPGLYVVAHGAVASLSQDLANINRNKRRLLLQILSPVPVVPSKHDIKLAGAHATLRVSDLQPEFYFRTADKREPNVALVRAQVQGNHRLLVEVNTNVVGVSQSKQRQMLTEGWMVAQGVHRYTLEQKLEPGEYAFLETNPETGLDYFVWDFGVDPPGPPTRKP